MYQKSLHVLCKWVSSLLNDTCRILIHTFANYLKWACKSSNFLKKYLSRISTDWSWSAPFALPSVHMHLSHGNNQLQLAWQRLNNNCLIYICISLEFFYFINSVHLSDFVSILNYSCVQSSWGTIKLIHWVQCQYCGFTATKCICIFI